jgi:hypothetical protein
MIAASTMVTQHVKHGLRVTMRKQKSSLPLNPAPWPAIGRGRPRPITNPGGTTGGTTITLAPAGATTAIGAAAPGATTTFCICDTATDAAGALIVRRTTGADVRRTKPKPVVGQPS